MGLKKHRIETLSSLYVDIFNQTTVGFVLVDKNGIIKDTNETFRKLFGYGLKSDLRDKNIEICQIDEIAKREFKLLSDYVLSGNNIIQEEFQLLSKSGEKIWCEISGTLLIQDDRMKDSGILWDIVDIREKIATRELLAKQHTKLNKLNNNLNKKIKKGIKKLREQDKLLIQQTKMAMMGEMLDAIAHQWKQPLGVIKLSASEIPYYSKEEHLDEKYLDTISKRIESQVDHLVQTVDEFRDFFRPKDTIKSENIKTVIDSAIRIVKDQLIKYTVNIEIIGDMGLCAKLIPNEFKHIIINLINNAKDQFIINSIENRLIIVELIGDKKQAILKVRDNAGGIPDEYIDKIFDANFTTKEIIDGTGIGLYMTKNILEKIDASIEVKNIQNGAEFIIRIPI